jgi:hypothetical protein
MNLRGVWIQPALIKRIQDHLRKHDRDSLPPPHLPRAVGSCRAPARDTTARTFARRDPEVLQNYDAARWASSARLQPRASA